MAILENEVWIKIGNNKKYYKELGYEIPESLDKKGRITTPIGTNILVKVDDLSKGSKARVTKICDDCGLHIQNQKYALVLIYREKNNGVDRCKKCGALFSKGKMKRNAPYRRSLEYFAKTNNKDYLLTEFSVNNNITPDKIFRGSNDMFIWNCIKCGSTYTKSANSRTYLDTGCPYCAGYKVNHTNSLKAVSPRISNEWHPTKNGRLTPNDVVKFSRNKVWWKCNKCNYEWEARVSTRSEGKGCPQCSESKGERKIKEWLVNNHIEFVQQKEYEGLIGTGGGLLSYDFFLPELNILIEYQGQFHDGKIGGQYIRKNLEKQQEHDRRKSLYAKQNNIKMLEIWYWDFDNIEEILSGKLITLLEK